MNTATQAELWLKGLDGGPARAAEGGAPTVEGPPGRLATAGAQLRRTWRRLQMVRSAAFDDEYDPDACETAALLYRRAVQDVHEARAACAAAPSAPTLPTARLLFARWLVQTGRLSEDFS